MDRHFCVLGALAAAVALCFSLAGCGGSPQAVKGWPTPVQAQSNITRPADQSYERVKIYHSLHELVADSPVIAVGMIMNVKPATEVDSSTYDRMVGDFKIIHSIKGSFAAGQKIRLSQDGDADSTTTLKPHQVALIFMQAISDGDPDVPAATAKFYKGQYDAIQSYVLSDVNTFATLVKTGKTGGKSADQDIRFSKFIAETGDTLPGQVTLQQVANAL